MAGLQLLEDGDALARLAAGDIEQLTEAATQATFYGAPLTDAQIAANKRIVAISEATGRSACSAANQSFVAAFADKDLAGYMIATRHAPGDHELDWLMVRPKFHGTPVSGALMRRGMDWLGLDKPMWLNVIAFNTRAIRFYQKFGFVIDDNAITNHVVPHRIMRRRGDSEGARHERSDPDPSQ